MARTRKAKSLGQVVTLSANATEFDAELMSLQPGEQMTYQPEDQPEFATAVTAVVAPQTTAIEGTTHAAPVVGQLVTLRLPAGTQDRPQYLITPPMGGKERWFEKKRLASHAKQDDGSWMIELPARMVRDRKLHDMVA